MKYDDLKIGQTYETTRKITSDDVITFAELTGDKNPLHIDEEYAKKTTFGKRISHGMLVLGFLSSVLGMEFPGPGTIYMSQSAKFLKPVFVGETIKIKLEVIKKDDNKKRALLKTTVLKENGEIAIDGEALLSLKNL
ncbi:MaoC family dehydratase [Thermosipho ferrireducens]|uniref:MaoC family dehydratase n=1 Tax=Thermosipho ferrireducens TaxID=2571116 RepID=A0ABX7S4D6_9BACT|nr:MaoC family dehydratase [Thermosipho ferrireducens]QTA37299.1 MaoC family dehydratase [Thermosipho ferrireducens]